MVASEPLSVPRGHFAFASYGAGLSEEEHGSILEVYERSGDDVGARVMLPASVERGVAEDGDCPHDELRVDTRELDVGDYWLVHRASTAPDEVYPCCLATESDYVAWDGERALVIPFSIAY